ncbi:hypothetical protein [Herbiconiux sp. VKM Ac-2851]|uniref:hypothetical protein n=1 Tax=Herbiconiux sp. VKM Ac-2851 TaxID=2739025 RepID=UPI0015661EA9|nr:hypothetical protein [Herbiconiux sp. VKM Ac-2851]NQX34568.1 hypothetical protein [Herbiconiux sp. VKM Ac-2851]
MPGFVIEYHRRSGVWSVQEFSGPEGHKAALLERLEREDRRVDEDVEIVSLNSDSLSTIKKTHARYFTGRELLSA